MSVAGRRADVDAGTGNMPGGEVFLCPVETSAQGTIAFTEFPAQWGGRELRGVRLRFSEGRVVDASAATEDWDIVKDLRSGGHIELDGKIVQKDGVWID